MGEMADWIIENGIDSMLDDEYFDYEGEDDEPFPEDSGSNYCPEPLNWEAPF